MQVLDRVPSIQFFDRCIDEVGGVTSALELRREVLQLAKQHKPNSQEQREIDLVRQLSALRREVNFFRSCYESAEAMVFSLYSISQEMYLNYYLRPIRTVNDVGSQYPDVDWSQVADTEWLRRADELVWHIQAYERVVIGAEAEWIELSRNQALRDKSGLI